MNKGWRGQSVIEILIASGVFIIVGVSVTSLILGSRSLLFDSRQMVTATNYAQEGLDALRVMRNQNWNTIPDGTYGLAKVNGSWQLSTSLDKQGAFTRSLTIASTATTTKAATSKVTWPAFGGRTASVSLGTLLTNWRNLQTSTALTGDWQHPQTAGSIDLGPGNNGTDLKVRNKIVYMTALASSTAKPDFYIVDATNPASPTIKASLDTGPGLNALDINGNYAYVATNDPNNQLQIIDISNISAPKLVKSYKLPGLGTTTVGQSIQVVNTTVYIGTTKDASGSEFQIIDVTDPNNPTQVGSLRIGQTINSIKINGTQAYIARAATPKIQIIDISNPTTPTSLGGTTPAGTSQDGTALAFLNNHTLFYGQLTGTSNEIYSLDTTSPTNIQTLGSTSIGSTINTLLVQDYLLFAATSDSNKEFQIFNITNPSQIVPWSSLNFPQVANAIAYEKNTIYVSVRSNDALRIIQSTQ